MATTLLKGTGKIAVSDFKNVKFTGRTKAGNPIEITLKDAISMSNIDWTFAEKGDVVTKVTFTATYSNRDAMVASDADMEEPWEVKYTPGSNDGAADEIMLGAGVVTIGSTDVALTRGGNHFLVEREYREINADGDRGPVKDRIVIDGSRATLEINSLVVLTRLADLFPGIKSTTTT